MANAPTGASLAMSSIWVATQRSAEGHPLTAAAGRLGWLFRLGSELEMEGRRRRVVLGQLGYSYIYAMHERMVAWRVGVW